MTSEIKLRKDSIALNEFDLRVIKSGVFKNELYFTAKLENIFENGNVPPNKSVLEILPLYTIRWEEGTIVKLPLQNYNNVHGLLISAEVVPHIKDTWDKSLSHNYVIAFLKKSLFRSKFAQNSEIFYFLITLLPGDTIVTSSNVHPIYYRKLINRLTMKMISLPYQFVASHQSTKTILRVDDVNSGITHINYSKKDEPQHVRLASTLKDIQPDICVALDTKAITNYTNINHKFVNIQEKSYLRTEKTQRKVQVSVPYCYQPFKPVQSTSNNNQNSSVVNNTRNTNTNDDSEVIIQSLRAINLKIRVAHRNIRNFLPCRFSNSSNNSSLEMKATNNSRETTDALLRVQRNPCIYGRGANANRQRNLQSNVSITDELDYVLDHYL